LQGDFISTLKKQAENQQDPTCPPKLGVLNGGFNVNLNKFYSTYVELNGLKAITDVDFNIRIIQCLTDKGMSYSS